MLLEEMAEDFILLNKIKTSDNQGGYTTEWVEGATIKAVIVNDTSMRARIGESEGVTSTFTITTTRSNALEFHDVLKRVRDNKIFRVTSDGDDKQSPKVASMDMAQVSAEAWTLTT